MADANQLEFGQRLRRISRIKRQPAPAYMNSVNHDGLVIARTRVKKSRSFSFRGLFLGLLILLAFKAFLFAKIGPQSYQDRVTLLQGGSAVEQVGAYVMKADPLTIWLAAKINVLMK